MVTVLLVLGVVVIVRVGTLVKELKEKVREFEKDTDDVHRRIDNEGRELTSLIKETLNVLDDVKDVLHKRIDDEMRDVYDRINHVAVSVNEVQDLLDRRVDNEMRDVYSQLDSRLDKLENKIKSNKGL
jgi:uncharacterized membrane-anchored protein YhcB (DUF1043 family)